MMPKMSKSTVIMRSVKQRSLVDVVQECLTLCDWQRWISPGATVVIKPNVCTAVPEKVLGSNTSKGVVEALCQALLTRTRRITIGEAGHLRQNPWQAYTSSGYDVMAKKLGVELINFSEQPTASVKCEPIGSLALPRRILEADVYINVPVLKTHALTYFTGALKNQWGCVPDCHDRLRYHRHINVMLSSIQRILQPKMILMDATIGMEGRGPVAGGIRHVDALLASRDPVAIDATAMRLVGLEPSRASHVRIASDRGLGSFEKTDIEVDGPWEQLVTKFEPPPRDIANRTMFFATQSSWFIKHVLANDRLYYPIRDMIVFLRKLGMVAR